MHYGAAVRLRTRDLTSVSESGKPSCGLQRQGPVIFVRHAFHSGTLFLIIEGRSRRCLAARHKRWSIGSGKSWAFAAASTTHWKTPLDGSSINIQEEPPLSTMQS